MFFCRVAFKTKCFPEDLHAEKFLGPHLSQRRQRSLKWNRVAQRQVVDELGLDYEEVEGFRQSLGQQPGKSHLGVLGKRSYKSILRIFDLHSNWAA